MKPRRFAFVLVVAAVVVGAIIAGDASARNAAPAPPRASSGGGSAVWFCPGLPAAQQQSGGRVSFANLSGDAADVIVTDLPDAGAPSHTTFTIAGSSVVTKARRDLGLPGALTVETFGGDVVVEDGVLAARAVAFAPCADTASAHAYFAAGATPRGVGQTLVIQNPYASDAKVDVTLRTSSGVHKPDQLQSLDITRRSRAVIRIDQYAVREDRVAVEVDAELGTFVATQSLVFDSGTGTPGVALALGAPAPSGEWTFAGETVPARGSAWVAVANVGGADAPVVVQATQAGPRQPLPVSFTVAQDNVVWVQLGHCGPRPARGCLALPDNVSFTLDVRSGQGVAIVAQTLTRGPFGLDGTLGAPAAASRWIFPFSSAPGVQITQLSVFNPAAAPARVGIVRVHGGRVEQPSAWKSIVVAPGKRTDVTVASNTPRLPDDAAIVVQASAPVFVERSIATSSDASRSVGFAAG